MATGTGKTYTAFQIIWRLWKVGRKKCILLLAETAMSSSIRQWRTTPPVRPGDGEAQRERKDH